MMGVHTNMCVLGRPFGIRQQVKMDLNVALVRDLTDTMYDPRHPPYVSHERGTELVIEHIEKYWCPSFESVDLTASCPVRRMRLGWCRNRRVSDDHSALATSNIRGKGMNKETYIVISIALGIGAIIALVVMAVSFVAMIWRWKTATRRKHAIRMLVATAAVVGFIGVHQALLWFVFLPALNRKLAADLESGRAERLAETSVLMVGDSPPHFELTTVDGDPFSLAESQGDVVLINFFATWCGPCRLELPHIERIWKARKEDPHFRLLVIGREETVEAVREYCGQNGCSFPVAADPDRAVYALFATERIPRTVVISPTGSIVYSRAGFFESDLAELNAVLDEQLSDVRLHSRR